MELEGRRDIRFAFWKYHLVQGLEGNKKFGGIDKGIDRYTLLVI